jgi:tetratricopeptide (TPR) repeat protein
VADGLSDSEPDFRLTGIEAFAFGIGVLDEQAQELLRAGHLAEAIDVYQQDTATLRNVVAVALNAGAARDERLDRAVDFRTAHALRNMGTIEALRVRVDPALDRTAEAVRLLRRLDTDQPEPIVRDEFIKALHSFALTRALCRTQLTEAADAISEVLRLLDQLAMEDGEVSDNFRAGAHLLARQIQQLREYMAAGRPAGIPGSTLPGTDWRADLAESSRQPILERMDVQELVHELGNADQAEALLCMMDERGDADGAYKHGILLQARGDLAAAEAAYRRGAERGSHAAAYQLGILRKNQRDTPGAIAALEEAGQSDDKELASKAQRALDKLTRTRRFPWTRRSS